MHSRLKQVNVTSAATDKAPMGRRERKKLERREEILACAKDLFDRHGFEGVSVETIAEAADVSLRTLYNFFPTKLDLLVAAFIRTLQDRTDEALRPLADPPAAPMDGVMLWVETHFRVYAALDRDLVLRSTVQGLSQGAQQGGGRDLAQHRLFSIAEVRRLLDIYVARRSLVADAPIDELARLIFALANGEYFQWIADPDEPVDAVLDRMRSHISLALAQALAAPGRGKRKA
jgi:AcrR family transcriptional regulator